MRVSKRGSSFASRLPRALLKALRLGAGDDVEIHSAGNRAELLKQLRQFRGRLPVDFKFSREEANSR
ncbi:AbrB/MazE/SpoVT family DNA-binding domain-containing protein [Dongia sedimenti]|uniref:AbrB/MazE/SpoVT family DNA-binding domain-containing protein n=1 Tax=Dongia sedimenti TaxID=3064282 RepID=A0ABU0YK75_9PROT|nr:AbrB/MazE/SpoVT family DNA-binding domain-containing protein [Rhodospirillaceae bacterium R-7]